MNRVPALIAHRGDLNRFPENSLEGITAALESGVPYIEFDVQLCADEIPVVIHDANLKRTAGVDLSVLESGINELRQHCVGEPDRFGERFSTVRLPTLFEIVKLLRKWKQTKAFVEIKRSSLRHFGHPTVLHAILPLIRPILNQCVVISFDNKILFEARKEGVERIGWVLEDLSEQSYKEAKELAPDYLFCDEELVTTSLWPGDWLWVVYEINDPQQALDLASAGVDLIETGNISKMLQHPTLKLKSGKDD